MTNKDINVPINDCISRQAAIDAADRADYTGLAVEDVKKVTDEVVKELKQLPSAQPEIKPVEYRDCANAIQIKIITPGSNGNIEFVIRTERGDKMNDLINRQDAIDSICKYCEYYYNENLIQTIKDLPSVNQ